MNTDERMTDVKKLSAWIRANGTEARVAIARTGLGFQTIDRMIRGEYNCVPRRTTRKLLCDATGLHEDELFPLVTTMERASS